MTIEGHLYEGRTTVFIIYYTRKVARGDKVLRENEARRGNMRQ